METTMVYIGLYGDSGAKKRETTIVYLGLHGRSTPAINGGCSKYPPGIVLDRGSRVSATTCLILPWASGA